MYIPSIFCVYRPCTIYLVPRSLCDSVFLLTIQAVANFWALASCLYMLATKCTNHFSNCYDFEPKCHHSTNWISLSLMRYLIVLLSECSTVHLFCSLLDVSNISGCGSRLCICTCMAVPACVDTCAGSHMTI